MFLLYIFEMFALLVAIVSFTCNLALTYCSTLDLFMSNLRYY